MDTFSIKDQAAWDKWCTNNTDPYGSAIIRYAARWAAMMEACMSAGQKLEDVARQTSHDAELVALIRPPDPPQVHIPGLDQTEWK